MKLSFSFGFRHDGLGMFYNGNLFGHASLKGDFIVLDLDENYNDIAFTFVSYFDSNSKSVKCHA